MKSVSALIYISHLEGGTEVTGFLDDGIRIERLQVMVFHAVADRGEQG